MTATDLAAALGGYVIPTLDDGGPIIIVRDGDRVHTVECRLSGRVVLDGTFQLGGFSDGVEVLAEKYRAAVDAAVAS